MHPSVVFALNCAGTSFYLWRRRFSERKKRAGKHDAKNKYSSADLHRHNCLRSGSKQGIVKHPGEWLWGKSASYNLIMVAAGAHTPNAFIRQLPKAELHLHLEGAVEPATLVELRRKHGESATLANTEPLYRYNDFPSFLMAFKEVSAHLRGPDD